MWNEVSEATHHENTFQVSTIPIVTFFKVNLKCALSETFLCFSLTLYVQGHSGLAAFWGGKFEMERFFRDPVFLRVSVIVGIFMALIPPRKKS